MKITLMSPENRPRERLETHGPQALSTAELLAIILKSGTKKENVLEISNKLLSKYGLEKLSQCSLNELNNEYGIGQAKSCQILALFELFHRFNQNKPEANKITSAKELAQLYLPKMSHLKQEQFVAVYLDTKNKIIGEQVLTIGTLNTSLIHPREVFHGAIKHLAHSLIVIHNHPSGDPAPSTEDLEVTEKLQETGEVVGIKLLDHLIIGKEKWWSWKEENKKEF